MAPASHVARHDTLVGGRAKRATAGNRMRALLDSELEQETGFEEVEDDVDFVGKDEEDAFESDFASTDDEAGDDPDEDAEERQVRRDEKHQRKLSRANPTRDPSMNYLKPRAQPRAMPSSLDPSAPSNAAPRRPPKQPRIAFADDPKIPEGSDGLGEPSTPGLEGVDDSALDQGARAGETAEEKETRRRRRASGRTATIAFKSEVDARLAAEAEERLKMPSRYKPPPPKARYTQDELIEEALYTEEMNNESLQDWLEKEEARRLALRVVRKKIEGPVVTWISSDSDRRPLIEELVEEDVVESEEGTEPLVNGKGKGKETTSMTASPSKAHKNAAAASSRTKQSASSKSRTASNDQDVEERHARNLVLLNPAPTTWSGEMRALFGTHVNWSTMRVVSARNRPQTRRPPLCPITGLQASYLDPRSGIPYANITAYATLTALLAGSYTYSAELGGYVGGEDVKPAEGIDEVEWKGEAKEERELEEAKARARSRRIEEAEERQRMQELGEMAPIDAEEEQENGAHEEMDGVEDMSDVVVEVEERAPFEKGTKRKRPSMAGEMNGSGAAPGMKRKKT